MDVDWQQTLVVSFKVPESDHVRPASVDKLQSLWLVCDVSHEADVSMLAEATSGTLLFAWLVKRYVPMDSNGFLTQRIG